VSAAEPDAARLRPWFVEAGVRPLERRTLACRAAAGGPFRYVILATWDAIGVRIEQTFAVASPPESVFDYLTDPENLAEWQTSKTRVEVLTAGPPREGYRVREWTKVPGRKEFEQVVEFTQFVRPNRLHTHIVEGPQQIDGTWVFIAARDGTRVDFVAEGPLRGPTRIAEPIVMRMIDRQFSIYLENLRRNLVARS
jgi:uncharacterized protein YndB with AHSA1/START domain